MARLSRKPPQSNLLIHILCLLVLLPILAACSTVHKLPSTPNIYSADAPYPGHNIAASEQGVVADIFYVTDRNAILESGDLQGYDDQRSESMAFGIATVGFGSNVSWDELVKISQVKSNRTSVDVQINSVNEVERFPATPLIFSATPDGIIIDANEATQYRQSTATMQNIVAARLEAANQSDVILYIHGFNNSFEDAVLDLNDVWHFSGRQAVPIAYSWPSGSGNLLGYFTDRESGEFTVYHLKETIRLLSSMPQVENIHIIAHSRGTDIATTALRELVIETRAYGHDPVTALKVENLILAAPDLDYGVVTQRLIAEKFGPAFGQITIYMNESDSALGISQMLMKGLRFGRLTANEQSDREAQIFENIRNVSFINVEGVKGFVGHGYFSEHPGALSDIVTLISTSSPPGTSLRPLTKVENNFWSLDRSYLDNTSSMP